MAETTTADSEDVFRITLKSRAYHADLLEAARKCGGIKALAARLGINSSTLGNWVLLKTFPTLSRTDAAGRAREYRALAKKWPRIARELYELTGKTAEQLFPDFVRLSGVLEAPKVSEVTREFTAGDMLAFRGRPAEALPSPEGHMECVLTRERIERALKMLTYREREILKLRYGLNEGKFIYSLEEVARIFKITRERVRQIEAGALRKLQHPVRARVLLPAAEVAPEANPCPRCGKACAVLVRCWTSNKLLCPACRDGIHGCRTTVDYRAEGAGNAAATG